MPTTPTLRIRVAPNYRDPQMWTGKARYSGTLFPGLLKLEGDDFVLQYEEAVYGYVSRNNPAQTRTFHIPISTLESVDYRKSWWGNRVILLANDLTALEGIFGAYDGRLTLYVRRSSRGLAPTFVNDVRLRISEIRIQRG